MSELLPSELARLILGYFESKGFTRTVETMLTEIPELFEVMQRRKKGQKVKLKVRDYFLTDLLDDYFTAKDIVYESITNYPATFSSVKKIQALADQVKNIVEIAIRSKTYKFYPKNLYRSKQYIQSKIAEENDVELPNEIAITVGDFEEAETTSDKRLDVDTTPESSLPGSSERVSNLDAAERNNDNAYQSKSVNTNSEEIPPDCGTPQKRKGSLRKKGRPSPNAHPKTPKQIEADERMEKLLKNLIENKELHTKIADSINSTLFSSSNTERNVEREELSMNQNSISNNNNNNNNRNTTVLGQNNFNANVNHPQQHHVKNSSSEYNGETSSELRNSSLSDIIISNLSLQVTNDPVMDSILASIDCDTQSSHRQLSTPVPEFPISQTNLSFSDSVYRLPLCESQGQLYSISNNQPPPNSEQNSFTSSDSNQTNKTSSEIACVDSFTLKTNPNINVTSSVSSTIIGEHLKNQETSQALTLGECFRNPNVNVDLDKAQNITLMKYVTPLECVKENPEKCSESPELITAQSTHTHEDQHTVEQSVEPNGSGQRNEREFEEIDPDKNNSNISNINQLSVSKGDANLVESNSVISNGEIAKLICLTEGKASYQSETNEYHANKPDCVMNLDNAPGESLRDKGSIISRDFELACNNANSSSDLPQNYEMSPNASSDRPPPVRAIPVALSNDSLVDSKYLSGTPDHPSSYIITELTPLPPGTPSGDWNSDNMENLPITSNTNIIESTSNDGDWNSDNMENLPITSNTNIIESTGNDMPLLPSETVNECSNFQLCTSTDIEVSEVAKINNSASNNDNQCTYNSDSQNCENLENVFHETDQQPVPKSSTGVKRKRGRKRKVFSTKRKRGRKRKLLSSEEGNRKKKKSVFGSFHRLNKRKVLKKKLNKKGNLYSSNITYENEVNMEDVNEDLTCSEETRWVGTAEQLSKISNLSHIENLVTELESTIVEENEKNQNADGGGNEKFVNESNPSSSNMHSKSSTDLSPQLQSLVSFSKTFVLNTSTSRKEETPSCNERITVYKGSLSSPRNKNTHIRVLDFNTPRKISNSKKESPKGRAKLKFSPSPNKSFFLNTKNRRVRTQSLTLLLQKKVPLESILESSREGIDSFIIENESSEKNKAIEVNLCNTGSNTKDVMDHSLSEGEGAEYAHDCALIPNEYFTTKEVSSSQKKLKSVSLQTPGKDNPLICLEPSTPFPEIATVSTTLQNIPGTELNTPNPASISVTVATPCITSCEDESISQDSYYEPSEKSMIDSLEEDSIESTLIKTAQLHEIEMVKLTQQEPQISPRNSQDSNEFVQEKREGDSLFSGLLKNRPKYKLRKMTNKELGEAVEQEMNLLEQMRNLLEEQEKPNSNSEETDGTSKTGERDKNAKELKKTRMFNEKGKCSSKQRNCLSRKKTSKALNSITYEDFGNNFELLKECFVECLQCSYIESARTLLPYHLELFEKQKSYQSNFQEEKIVEHMIKMINYYSSPSMMRSMQQKVRKYKSVQKNRNCEEKETFCDKSNSKNLPKKKNRKVKKDNESDNADTSVNILECEIDVVIEGKSKINPHLEPESLKDFQRRENCIDDTKIASVDKLNLTSRNKIKEKENKIVNSSRFKSNVTTPSKAKHWNESDNNNLSVYSPKNKKSRRNEDYIQTVEENLNRTPEMSKSFSQANEDDEYCLIERQLAALDGSVINSPFIRAELTSNTMDDNNISVMFTPSNQVSEDNFYLSSISDISKEILPTLSPVKMMSFTPLPGTPVKRVEEICQSVVKNKVALVAIPSQSFGNNNSSLNIMADLEITEDSTLLSDSYSKGAVSVEKDVYLSDENSQHENSVYTLSFSEYLDIFSLNLSPKSIKRQRINKAKTENKKKCKNVSENKKAVAKRKYSILKEDKSNSSKQKGRPSIQSSKKCKRVNKEVKIGTLDDSVTSKSKRSPQSQSSARKLNFVTTKRKREEVGETRHAKIRKLAKFTDNIQTNNGQGTKQKPNSSLKSIPDTDDMVLEKQTSENVPKDINKTTESEIHSNNKDTLDDSESLVELHLSSSDSESNQDSTARTSKKSPPENISSSLLKGGSFELSTTPNKLQTVISKFPNQDNYNDESYFSIPPTPGKHLFLPESNKITDASTNQMNLDTYALGESSYNSNVKSCDVPPHTSQEKRKSSSKVTKSRKQRVSPKNQSDSPKKSKKSSICSENNSDKATNIATKDIFSKLKGLFGESFSSDENIPSLKGQKKSGEKASSKRRKVNEKKADSSSGNEAKKLLTDESTTLSINEKKNLQLLLNLINTKKN